MNFIMTGHKGLIGTFLLEELKKRGDTPVALLDSKENHNLLDIESLTPTQPADTMIHLASFCKINKIISNPELALENNTIGTHKVLEYCRKNNIKKIVFTSSSRVLSKEKNPYTASKIFGEELVKGYQQCYGIEYVIIRPSTVYGGFNDHTLRLIDVFILNALHGKELPIYGDPKTKTLDFTYIDDFIEGMILAMKQKNKEFDISAGTEVKIDYIADLIIKLAGKGTKKICPAEIAQPQEVKLDITPLKTLGFTPKTSIEEGIQKTFAWYKKHFNEIMKTRI